MTKTIPVMNPTPEILLPVPTGEIPHIPEFSMPRQPESVFVASTEKMLSTRQMMGMGGAELAARLGEEFLPDTDKNDLIARIRRQQGYELALAAFPLETLRQTGPEISIAKVVIDEVIKKPEVKTVSEQPQPVKETVKSADEKAPEAKKAPEAEPIIPAEALIRKPASRLADAKLAEPLKTVKQETPKPPKAPKQPKDPRLAPLAAKAKSATLNGAKSAATKSRELASSALEKATNLKRLRKFGRYATAAIAVSVLVPVVEEGIDHDRRPAAAVSNNEAQPVPSVTPETTVVATAPTEVTTPAASPEAAPPETTPEEETVAAPVPSSTAPSTTTPETTAPAPATIMDRLSSGEMTLAETAGQHFATIDIPAICLNGIDAYGSYRRSIEEPAVLDWLQANGGLTDENRRKIENGTSPYALEADMHQVFDPIYKVFLDETPQAACDIGFNSEYPGRWEHAPKGSTLANNFAKLDLSAANIQPIVEIDSVGVAPGQAGNVVVAGHRTTEGAPFYNLDGLKIGDTITVTGDNGQAFTYMIEATGEINADDPAIEDTLIHYQSPSGNVHTLTAYACDDGSAQRLYVHAVLVA